jgi:hypothetical protein
MYSSSLALTAIPHLIISFKSPLKSGPTDSNSLHLENRATLSLNQNGLPIFQTVTKSQTSNQLSLGERFKRWFQSTFLGSLLGMKPRVEMTGRVCIANVDDAKENSFSSKGEPGEHSYWYKTSARLLISSRWWNRFMILYTWPSRA